MQTSSTNKKTLKSISQSTLRILGVDLGPMSAKHSPAPWHAALRVRGFDSQVVGPSGLIAEVYDDLHEQETALLIAAAPEMLEALQLVLDFHAEDTVAFVAKYGTGIGTRELCDRVRAAMAKAVMP